MINAKGEWVYTNSEIGNELGISPATVGAISRRLFGHGKIPRYTINEAKLIAQYALSTDSEEEGRRLALLHNTINPGRKNNECTAD